MPAREPTGSGWVLLSYRMPREPSTPRIAVWRTLKRLGVAQLGDGLVALPADARTQESLEWVAQDVTDAGGTATIWLARPVTPGQEREVVAAMRDARAKEYAKVTDEAATILSATILSAGDPGRAAALRRLRGELRRINRRDYLPPPERDRAHAAVAALAEAGDTASAELS